MKSKKDRRNSGRKIPPLTIKGKKEDIINECLEPQEYWNDYLDYRDSFRNWYPDDGKKIKAKTLSYRLSIPKQKIIYINKYQKYYKFDENNNMVLDQIIENKNHGFFNYYDERFNKLNSINQKLIKKNKIRKVRKLKK